LLSHYATHGFFVVASNNTNVGSGSEMIAGMRWAIAENERSGSPYFGKLDPDAVGSIGYSQGGIGSSSRATNPKSRPRSRSPAATRPSRTSSTPSS